ncbi:MAG: hypothetical protein BWY70_01117 [Bacteroidetes bacterium ADurb.Bin408]|nr:MAG: hypothetical protein BWY70_01117 [Bacteroidetes bacterium ADurb.Bin408]
MIMEVTGFFYNVFRAVSGDIVPCYAIHIMHRIKVFAIGEIEIVPLNLATGLIVLPQVGVIIVQHVVFVEPVTGQVAVVIGVGVVGVVPVEHGVAIFAKRIIKRRL